MLGTLALAGCGGEEQTGEEPIRRVEIDAEGSTLPNVDMPADTDTVVAPLFDVEPANDTSR